MADKARPTKKRKASSDSDDVNIIEGERSVEASLHTVHSIEEAGPSSAKKTGYSQFFQYHKDDEPCATCMLCQKHKVKKVIKMKQGNTSGLKKHLNAAHKSEYNKLFGEKASSLKGQHKITALFPKKVTCFFIIVRIIISV